MLLRSEGISTSINSHAEIRDCVMLFIEKFKLIQNQPAPQMVTQGQNPKEYFEDHPQEDDKNGYIWTEMENQDSFFPIQDTSGSSKNTQRPQPRKKIEEAVLPNSQLFHENMDNYGEEISESSGQLNEGIENLGIDSGIDWSSDKASWFSP